MARRSIDAARTYDHNRANTSPFRKWYSTAGWKSIRKRRLETDPLCCRCSQRGLIVPSDTVNHIKPHRGNRALFFCYENTEAVCKICHDRFIQREEIHGYSNEVGPDGWPIDARHPANRIGGRGGV